MSIIRMIAAVFGALKAYLEIQVKKTNYQIWKDSLKDEEAIMDRITEAIEPSDPERRPMHDAYVNALRRKLRHQQTITVALAKQVGISEPPID